ncbi:MAG: LysM peptidoglycan-binding domain-containing protein [Spirochaetaceae bacterium]|jgi:hypothetical protein|nr:LysM peptidoglycan-binding domain-containing protein [Spirochaetaceae bacterium]
MIGIKTANGEFYPILEENSAVEKRLVLTTVHNKQASVHIDLYKSNNQTISDEGYIGSLVVEPLRSKPQGDPSIELIISSNKAGEITAEAIDLDAAARGEPQFLHVSLKTDDAGTARPDFNLDPEEYENSPPLGLYDTTDNVKSSPWGKIALIGLALLAVGFGIWCLLFGGFKGKNSAPASQPEAAATMPLSPDQSASDQSASGQSASDQSGAEAASFGEESEIHEGLPEPAIPEELAEETPPAESLPPELTAGRAEATLPEMPPDSEETPIFEAPELPAPVQPAVNRSLRNPPVASYKVPAVIPRGGFVYKIRWGDTLWDISEAFYRNPWLYPRIARFNKIRNPDLIIAGAAIRIPPKQ